MKSLFIVLSFTFVIFFSACSSNHKKVDTITINDGGYKDVEIYGGDTIIPVRNFKQIVDFVQSQGNGSDFAFPDKVNNIHYLTITRYGEVNKNATWQNKDSAVYIEGRMYYASDKDRENPVYYFINPTYVLPYMVGDQQIKNHIDAVKGGYHDLMVMVSK